MKLVGSIKEFWRIQKVLLIILTLAVGVLLVTNVRQGTTISRLRAENVQLREQIGHEIIRVDSLCAELTATESAPLTEKPEIILRVFTAERHLAAKAYYQSEEEALAVLEKIEKCMKGKGPAVIRVGSSVLRGEIIASAKIFRKGG